MSSKTMKTMDQKMHKVLTIWLLKSNRDAFCGLKLEYFKLFSLHNHTAKFQETLHWILHFEDSEQQKASENCLKSFYQHWYYEMWKRVQSLHERILFLFSCWHCFALRSLGLRKNLKKMSITLSHGKKNKRLEYG